ncbi:MAG: NBR1-Ig-like domain-containing protein [Myxococcota bacterium]
METNFAGLPPAGENAILSMSSIPTSMNPGEKLNVRVTMLNNGTASPANDWTTGNTFALYSQNSPLLQYGWPYTAVTSATPVGSTQNFDFVITAPAANPSASFRARMIQFGATGGYFGTQVAINNINVSNAVTRRWACSVVSTDLPTTMTTGFSTTAHFTVQNSGDLAGTGTWRNGTFCFREFDSNQFLWGTTNCPNVLSDVAPGGSYTFSIPIVAPSTPGTYSFRRQMFSSGAPSPTGGIGYFDNATPCINQSITVTAGAPQYDSAVSFQNFPTQMSPGQTVAVTVRMQNTGSANWDPTTFILDSQNTPLNLWNVSNRPVTVTIAPTRTATFTLNIRAPMVAGSYTHAWRMRKTTSPGAGFFGATISIPVQVNSCGNGQIDTGEQCDDGNATSNDGCSSTCQIEPRSIDLASASPDRRFNGSLANAQMQAVAIGDFDGTAPADIVVAQLLGASATGTTARGGAGTVYGYAGGAGFFSGATTVPTGSTFAIAGADINDNLGVVQGLIHVVNVVGDSTGDVILSASLADGASNGRADAGELIILTGGAGLTGYINLRQASLPAQVAARIIGPVAGGQMRLLDARDMNGDGRAELLLGVPFADPLGRTDAGQVYLLDGSTIGGTIDLSSVTPMALWNGAAANDRLGLSGAIGDYTGDTVADVAIGTPFATDGTLMVTRGGGVWGYTGPVSGTFDVASSYNLRLRGSDNTEQIGTAINIENVRGSATADLIVGGSQIYTPAAAGIGTASQRGGVLIFTGPVPVQDTQVNKAGNWGGAGSIVFGQDSLDLLGGQMAVGRMGTGTYADLAIGAQGADGPGNARNLAGALYVVRGNLTMAAQSDLSTLPASIEMDGAAANALLTRAASSIAIGDLDGDGKGDVCATSAVGAGIVACFRSTFP